MLIITIIYVAPWINTGVNHYRLQVTSTRYFVATVVKLTAGFLSGDVLGWLTHAVLVFRPCLELCIAITNDSNVADVREKQGVDAYHHK